MIVANELRINNYILFSEDGSLCKIIGIDTRGISVEVVNTKEITWIELDSFEPIHLTSKILRKCCFSERSLAFTGNIGFTIKEENFYIGLLSDEKGGWKFHNPHFNLTIKYLHQLQNLYFALTGQELNYKP